MERKIIVNIAVSADGYIARPDGGIDWLERPNAVGDYGMGAFLQSVDTVLWGRKTYEQMVVKRGTTGLRGDLKHYLFSHKRFGTPFSGFEYVKQPVKVFAQGLRSSIGRNIWIIGGGGLIGSFLDEGEIDEFRLHVIPIFLGSGIPLLEPRHRTVPLELDAVRKFSDSVLSLQYTVVKTAY